MEKKSLRTQIDEDDEPRVTCRQLDLMRHATGGSSDGYRNYYTVRPDSPEDREWLELVNMGLAYTSQPGDCATYAEFTDEITYLVTEAGFRMLYG